MQINFFMNAIVLVRVIVGAGRGSAFDWATVACEFAEKLKRMINDKERKGPICYVGK
jgi:hypothetical protein